MNHELGAGSRAWLPPLDLPRGLGLLYPALALLLCIFAVAPLTYPGSYQTQSGFNAVYNLMDLATHLPSGLGWGPTFGRGYDLFRMDGPFPYYVGLDFYLLGFGFAGSIKLVYALAFLLSGLGMYALARSLLKDQGAGLLAAAVYVYFPYHLADIYVRGALGEAIEWALFPLTISALLRLRELSSPPGWLYLASILLFALAVLAQPGLGLVFAAGTVAVFSMLARGNLLQRLRRQWVIPVGVVVGVTLLVPAFVQDGGSGGSYSFIPAFVFPFQFLTASWGSNLPKGSFLDQFPYQLGIAAIGLNVLALAFSFRSEGSPFGRTIRRIILAAVGMCSVAILLMMPFAAPVWTAPGLASLFEYPFQLLPLVGLAISVAAGSVVVADDRFSQTPTLAALVIIPVLSVYGYLAPVFLDFVPAQPPVAVFNQNEIALVDAKIVRPPGILRHGATVELDLQWQALRQVNHDYTVFVHAVDENGKQWGGEDTKPQDGALPTTNWDIGRVISDTHTVQIDLAGPPVGYHLELGMYTAGNGERAVTDAGATEIRIEENQE